MSFRGDHLGAMNRNRRELDEAIDTAIAEADTSAMADKVVATLVANVRSTLDRDPPPARGELQMMLAQGFDPATAGESQSAAVEVPAPPFVAPVNPRRPRMLEVALAKLAGLTLAAKLGLAGAAVAATTTGVGAAGVLPPPAQEAFDRVAAVVTNDEPATEVDSLVEDGDPAENVEERRVEPAPERVDDDVSEVIEGTDPQDRDRDFGEDVAGTASQNRQDGAVRNGDDTVETEDNEEGAEQPGQDQREQFAPDTPPAGPPTTALNPQQN